MSDTLTGKKYVTLINYCIFAVRYSIVGLDSTSEN